MAKIPTILEAGRADGMLIKTDNIYDDNKKKFLSDRLEEIDNNNNTLNNTVKSLTNTINNNKSDIETKLEAERIRATNAENNLRETINSARETATAASTAAQEAKAAADTAQATATATKSELVRKIDEKQDALIAGDNIKIENNVVSSIGAAKLLVSITWSELKALRDNSQLVAGTWYRITDYTCTTIQENTRSAGHIFDVIVRGDSENKLNEEAFAIQHEGDDYFASSNLSAWKLWYSLDNDTTRFAWADSTNGKGVIYRMIDEWNNDVPYDFKNIQFARDWSAIAPDSGLSGTVYCYTFSIFLDGFSEDAIANDESIKAKECIESDGEGIFGNNTIRAYQQGTGLRFLNDIIFVTDYSSDSVYHYSNSFGDNCHSNSFGDYCYSNSFGDNCYSNSFDYNCYSNSFGDNCHSNSFGDYCYSNSFGNDCKYIMFASDSSASTKYNYYQNNHFGDGCQYIVLKGAGDASTSQQLQNYKFAQGVQGTSSNYLIIDGVRNLSYETKVAKNSSGELKIYCEADLVQ